MTDSFSVCRIFTGTSGDHRYLSTSFKVSFKACVWLVVEGKQNELCTQSRCRGSSLFVQATFFFFTTLTDYLVVVIWPFNVWNQTNKIKVHTPTWQDKTQISGQQVFRSTYKQFLKIFTLERVLKQLDFNDLKCCLSADEMPKHTENATFSQIPMYVCTRPEVISVFLPK